MYISQISEPSQEGFVRMAWKSENEPDHPNYKGTVIFEENSINSENISVSPVVYSLYEFCKNEDVKEHSFLKSTLNHSNGPIKKEINSIKKNLSKKPNVISTTSMHIYSYVLEESPEDFLSLNKERIAVGCMYFPVNYYSDEYGNQPTGKVLEEVTELEAVEILNSAKSVASSIENSATQSNRGVECLPKYIERIYN